jgi:hypothetical protein
VSTNPRNLAPWFAILAAPVAAAAAPTTQPDLNAKIDALQTQIDQLKAQQKQQQEQEQQATYHHVLQDADTHSRLFDAEGIAAGYSDGRFLLRSEDGNFLLHPWLQLQFRSVTTWREDAKPGGRDDLENGFEIRRLKFGADGNLYTPDLTYAVQFAVDRHTGNVQLEMAWAKYHLPGTPFYVRGGQYKEPLDHEQLAASRYFPAIDRTLIDDFFIGGEGFVKGVSLIYDPGNSVRAEGAFTGGIKNFDTNFQQFPTGTADWGAAARGEYKLFGKWKDYDQITAYGVKDPSLVIGVGADYTETGHKDSLVHVVDAQFQTNNGIALYGAYLGRYTTHNTAAFVDTYDSTFRGQVSWAIDRHWEPYGRYEYIHFDGHEFTTTTKTTVHVITAGVNYYLAGFGAKVSVDLSYLPNGSPVADDGFGILTNPNHNELVGRAQFQVVF